MTQTKPENCPDGREHVWIEVEREVHIGGRTIKHHKCENCERHRAHMSSNPPKPIKHSPDGSEPVCIGWDLGLPGGDTSVLRSPPHPGPSNKHLDKEPNL